MRGSKKGRKERRYAKHSTPRYAVAVEAARLLYRREYKEYYQAKREAARRFGCKILPTNSEIHQQLLLIADKVEGRERTARLAQMRRAALEVMELLLDFHPKLIGSTWTGHIRKGSDVDLHLFSDCLDSVLMKLEAANFPYDVQRVQSRKYQKEMEFVHVHLSHSSGFEVEMTVYPMDWLKTHPKCSITGGPMARASLAELRQRIATEHPHETRAPEVQIPSVLQKALDEVDLNTLLPLLPELAACLDVQQNHYHHLDVFEHTVEVALTLREMELTNQVSDHLTQPGPGGWPRRGLLHLAALCHDIGKPQTKSFHPSGRIRFLGHEAVGAGMTRAISNRLDLPAVTAEALERLVALHMEGVLIPNSNPQSASRIWQLFRNARDLFPELMLLSLADVMSARGPAQPAGRVLEQELFVTEMMEEYFEQGFLRFPNCPVSSVDLECELGLTDARVREKLLDRLTESYVDGEFESREAGLAWASELLEMRFEEW